MTFFQPYLMALVTVILVGCASATGMDNKQSMNNMDEVKTMKIMRAESAAPMDISANATILDTDGTLLRQGTSDWICYPGIPLIPGDMHPMCNDPVWTEFLKAASQGKPFMTDRIGISYMLQGDANVSNSNPGASDPNNGEV